mgnify:FL=1
MENRYENRIVTLPNALTLFRVLLIPVFVWLYGSLKNHVWSAAVLGLSALTDLVDGWMARHFRMESNLGRILDPVADKLTQAAMCLMLLSRYPTMLALLIFFGVKEALLAALGYCYMRRTGIVNSARWYGKASSIVQYGVMLGIILSPEISDYTAHVLIALCFATHAISLVLYGAFYLRSVRHPESVPSVAMRPVDWHVMIMYLLLVASVFLLMFTTGDASLRQVLPKPLFVFLRFASIVGLLGIPAFFWGEKVPRGWFDPEKFPFRSFKWEQEGRIYEKIGIQHWKNHTPDMSKHFQKTFAKQGNLLRSPEHLRKLVAETCSAEFVHTVLILLSPAFVLLMDEYGVLAMVLYILGNLVSLIIQRYNRPRIMKIIQRIEKRNATITHTDR